VTIRTALSFSMRAATLGLCLAAIAAATPVEAPNTLSDQERASGWRLLWDGSSTRGWRAAKGRAFPASGWEIQDGVLSVVETGGAESRAGGDIVTEASFAAFELAFEFRLTPGANSGVKYYVDTGLNTGEGSAIGLEFQLLDDARHPDAKAGRDGNRTLGSLYDLIPAAASKPTRPIGEWNAARIVSVGRHVEHWLNGAKVLEYERGSEAFRTLVAASKYKVWPAFGERPSGPILLQDHGNRVSFRSLKIRELAP
jgi:3-keto-disaccharide hydrolase